MAKNYATSMCFNKTCMLKRDYSYVTNGKCLDCKFCYRHAVSGTKPKYRMAKMLLIEERFSPSLYQVPITISKYCDPNCTPTTQTNSRLAAERILHQGGQIIWRSAIPLTPARFINHPKVQVQGRIITADTRTGDVVRSMIAPNFTSAGIMLRHLKTVTDHGTDAVVNFDPLILGLNDADLYIVAQQAAQHGLKKIIVKQLFATDYFKSFLASNVGKDCSGRLTEKVGPFWTYKNELLMEYMHNVLQDTKDTGVEFSMCSNKEINPLLNDYNNCCMFNNPDGIYDITRTGKGYSLGIIDLKDE